MSNAAVCKLNVIANWLVGRLSAYNAVLDWNPDYDIKDLSDIKVIVTPFSKEVELASRNYDMEIDTFDVAVMQRGKNIDINVLVDMTDEIAKLIHKKVVSNSTCIAYQIEPLFGSDQYRQKNLFISVIRFTFKG